ncbi:MAG: glycosyltransferase family 9 protein, partial [Candidatus Eisenbacteria bacterium]|nr:glycosyltransferase family 9 protein [Candidatus Eisenbacteria bacterium]
MSRGGAAPRRVLIRLPNWLGDALMARPALAALAAALPAAHRHVVGPGALLELLRGEGVWQSDAALGDPESGPARVREMGPWDAAIVFPPSFSSAWWALRCGARRRVGFRGDARAWLLTEALRRRARGDLHLSREYLQLVASLGAPAVALPPLTVVPQWAAAAHARVGDARVAIVAPGAIYGPAKCWPPESFAEVGRALTARALTVLVCGTAAEADRCAQVAAAIPGAIDLAGRTGLGELTALCARAYAVVCNDSGLGHLAAATGALTISVFGSTSSAWTAPLGPRAHVVQRA